MTMILDLPKDLIEEIISRVPLKFMRAMRLACKEWDTLSKSRTFTKLHLAKTAAESRTIMLMDYNLYLKRIVVFNGIDVDPSIEPISKLTCLNDSEQVKISQVFYCEGLLLCILKDIFKLVVWNPYLGQTRWIEPRYVHRKQYGMCVKDMYKYALGYENKKNRSCPSYKILRFMDDDICPPGNYGAPKNRFFWYEIYDFDSGEWNTLDVTPRWRIWNYNRGVSVKGNTYWCSQKSKSKNQRKYIICFDFTKERFGPFLRLPFNAVWHDYVTLSCVGEEKLAVSLQHNEVGPEEIEIWITSKVEPDTVSWSKFLRMDMGPDFDDIPFSLVSFFIDEEKRIAMGFYKDYGNSDRNIVNFIGENEYFKELDLDERAEKGCQVSVCPYVPSLVQIKQNAGCKRKKLSRLERQKINTLVAIENPINKERYELRKRKDKN